MRHQRTGKLEAYMTLLSSDSELKNCGSILCSAIPIVKLLQILFKVKMKGFSPSISGNSQALTELLGLV